MHLAIEDKVALVCGAGSGLGRAIALAAEGVTVAVAGRTPGKLDETVALITGQGGRAQAFALDLSQPETFDDVLSAIRQALGPIGILVNNSGGPPPSRAEGVAATVWQAQFTAMLSALIQLTDKVLPDMRAAGWGRIITSTSSGAVAPLANLAISNTLRMALLGWSKTLASEVAAQGITANIIIPGRIATDRVGQLDAAKAQRENSTPEAVQAQSKASIPAGRYGQPSGILYHRLGFAGGRRFDTVDILTVKATPAGFDGGRAARNRVTGEVSWRNAPRNRAAGGPSWR